MNAHPPIKFNRVPMPPRTPEEAEVERIIADLIVYGAAMLPSGDIVYAPPSAAVFDGDGLACYTIGSTKGLTS